MLEYEQIDTGENPDACVIWLHGLGADGFDFVPIVPELKLPDSLRVRFIFPHAPEQPVTINNGYVLRAWYDIVAQDLRARQDESGTRQSQQALIELIEQQTGNGIRADRIILAGFSQGGAIALYTTLRYPATLAGVMALSTYLPLAESTADEAHDSNAATPVFMAHGLLDQVIPVEAAMLSRRQLESLGNPVQWQDYTMEHSLCPEEIRHISLWIQQRLQERLQEKPPG